MPSSRVEHMASWQYKEVTGDGGVALSFNEFQGSVLEAALMRVEEEDEGDEENQARSLYLLLH